MVSPVRTVCAVVAASAALVASSAAAGEPEWIRQFGTSLSAFSVDVAADGTVHVVGETGEKFYNTQKGSRDGFVISFDREGQELWRRQPGKLLHNSSAKGVATDGDGNVYVVGNITEESLVSTNPVSYDGFVIKLDRDGRNVWRRQLGTGLPSVSQQAEGVATDASGNVYVAGVDLRQLGQVFIIKFDRDGNELWNDGRDDIGTATLGSIKVATDTDGDVYLAGSASGYRDGDMGNPNARYYDAFLIKYGPDSPQ
ncbi:MAG: SBBP repeat-containing protein [Rhodospirillales bacterium]|nr:SBBP repeat-containing protein [Rhodospirillales bacterium]